MNQLLATADSAASAKTRTEVRENFMSFDFEKYNMLDSSIRPFR